MQPDEKLDIGEVPLEEQMRMLVDSVTDYAIYLLDSSGTVVSWNPGAERLKGYASKEIIGKNFSIFYTDEDIARNHPQYVLRSARAHGRYEEESWRVRKDGTHFLADIVITALKSEDGAVIGYAKVTRDITSRRQHEIDSNIARQLQQALLPPVPPQVPGLALNLFYEAALKESGVGGDFYDVFTIDNGCTALIVGDLSGKGLAAAIDVATIKNMLRFAVYNRGTLEGAVESLNATLTKHGLLNGFATLFVGYYDDGAQTLSYINCGQEPALILRKESGCVDELRATSMIVGAIENAQFRQESVPIMVDDIIAIFTDGLTEAGRSRDGLLGLEGIIQVLRKQIDGSEASRAIIQEVKMRAGTELQDDICLLVAQCGEAGPRRLL